MPSRPSLNGPSITDVIRPAAQQASNGASQDASNTASPQAEKLVTKSFRFPPAMAKAIKRWAVEHDTTEQDAAIQAFRLLMGEEA